MGLVWAERTGDDEGTDEQSSKETIERWRVMMSHESDGKKEIRAALPELAPYAAHPTEKGLYVARFRAKRQKPGSNIWEVEITYSTEVDLPENPLLVAAEITLDSEIEEVASLFDKDGKPYCNTAGELLEDSTNDECDLIFQVSKAIPLKWPPWLLEYGGAVNSDDITIKGLSPPAGTLKCKKIKIGKDQETEAGIDWCQLDFELHYRASGWHRRTLNKGFHQLVPKKQIVSKNSATAAAIQGGILKSESIQIGGAQTYDYVKILVKGENGALEEPSEPQPLDRQGALILNPNPQNLVILEFKRNDELPFNNLPLK